MTSMLPPKPPSEPPQVRAARVQWDAIENIIAMCLATVALFHSLIGPEVWVGVVGAASFGAGVLRAYGAKRAGVASLALLGAAKFLGGGVVFGARYLLVALVIAFGLGCGADLATAVQHVRIPVDALGRVMVEHHDKIVTACKVLPPDDCRALVSTYNDLATAQNAAADSVEALQSVTQ